MLLMQAQESDAWYWMKKHRLFSWQRTVTTLMMMWMIISSQKKNDLALNVEPVFEADECGCIRHLKFDEGPHHTDHVHDKSHIGKIESNDEAGTVLVTNQSLHPSVIHDSEDTRELAEITRNRMLLKMQSPLSLFKEVKEMEEIFDQMNNEVDKNTVDKQCAEIEKKNLLIENENLIVNCFVDSTAVMIVEKSRCLDLEADMSKVHDESKLISKLEGECLNLQLKYQHLQESFDNNKSHTVQEAPDFNSFFKIKNLEHQSCSGIWTQAVQNIDGQFCNSDLEVAFRKQTYALFVNKDLLEVFLDEVEKDHLCSACQLGKSKKFSHRPKSENTNMEVLHTLHMDLCGPMRVQSIKGKKYILVIMDDYSRFTWVKFLRCWHISTKVCSKNSLTKRRCRKTKSNTGWKQARTMRYSRKHPMFLWAEAVATACYTQNRSLIHTRHNKTPYELVHDKKPDLTFSEYLVLYAILQMIGEDLGKISSQKLTLGFSLGNALAGRAIESTMKKLVD
ncbi:retrovirus-related pol polyprotein from transposon TNT 1-94 [Tanacetum coccineum]